MARYGKWIGGGLGWAFGGPIGAMIGFMLGSVIDNTRIETNSKNFTGEPGVRYNTRPGDFSLSLIVLSAAVMKADKKIMKSELAYVRTFFLKQFGEKNITEMIRALNEIIKKNIPIREVCVQIRQNMQHPLRLQLLHYLFGIAKADGVVHPKEVEVIALIANHLGISIKDFNSIKAMFYQDTQSAYRILEITKSASNAEVKKAYRKMAVKHHPDKVVHLGEEFRKAAKEKFQKIQGAYHSIKKERGIA